MPILDKNNFHAALASLLSEQTSMSRKAWNRYLHISATAISQWVSSKKPKAPPAKHLKQIYDFFENMPESDAQYALAQKAFAHFKAVAKLPLSKTTPIAKEFTFKGAYKAPTLIDYMFEALEPEASQSQVKLVDRVKEEINRLSKRMTSLNAKLPEAEALEKLKSVGKHLEEIYASEETQAEVAEPVQESVQKEPRVVPTKRAWGNQTQRPLGSILRPRVNISED